MKKIIFANWSNINFKVTEDGRCQVARIMHGGLIHRQGMWWIF